MPVLGLLSQVIISSPTPSVYHQHLHRPSTSHPNTPHFSKLLIPKLEWEYESQTSSSKYSVHQEKLVEKDSIHQIPTDFITYDSHDGGGIKSLKSDDFDDINDVLEDVNDSATRATIFWRMMMSAHPRIASMAVMYWRMKAVRNSEKAACRCNASKENGGRGS